MTDFTDISRGLAEDSAKHWKTAYYEEAKKFQAETLRTSEYSKWLYRLIKTATVLDGHMYPAHGGCARCREVQQAVEALKDTVYYDMLQRDWRI